MLGVPSRERCNMERGFFKIYRKIEDSKAWSRGALYRGLMITLLQKANWKQGYFHGQKILPGQLAFSGECLADELDIPRTSVVRMLRNLELDGFLTRSNMNNRYTLVTITNWHSYQSVENNCGQPMVNHWSTDGRPVDTIKEGKKERINTPPLPPTGGKVCADEYELSCGTSANSMDTRPCEASLAADEIKAQSSLQAGGMEPRPCCPPNGDVTNTSDTGSRANSMDTRPCEAKGRKAKTPRMPKGADLPPYTEQFERIWAKYPRKDAKGKAYKAYMELLKAGALPDTDDLIERITYRKFEPDWERENGKYVPYFSTWLHNRGWEDAGCFSDTTPEQRARNERASAIYAKYNGGMWKPGLTVEQVEENCDRMYAELEAEGLL